MIKNTFKITGTFLFVFVFILSCSKDEVDVEQKKIDPPEMPASIKISASSTSLVADGEDEITFDVEVLDKKGDPLTDAAYDIFVNDKKLLAHSFTTVEGGEYTVLAKSSQLVSDPILINAINPEELVVSIVLEADSKVLINDGISSANLLVVPLDENKTEVKGVEYELLVNGSTYDDLQFKTLESGIYNVIAKVGEVTSNQININVRENKLYEEVSIPVVFHIVHFGEEVGTGNNLSSANIEDELEKLNAGFANKYNSSNANAVDTRIRFRLAKHDPNNEVLEEPGINRIDGTSFDVGSTAEKKPQREMPIADRNSFSIISSSAVGTAGFDGDIPDDQRFGYDESYELGRQHSWARNRYFNIYVLPIQNHKEISGFAYLPVVWDSKGFEGFSVYPKEFDPIFGKNEVCVLDTQNFLGTGSTTIIHELGHALGLHHNFSKNNCSTSDFCSDTYSYNYHDPEIDCADNLGVLEHDNFMDYEGTSNTFTFEQRERMRHVLNYGYFYSDLKNSTK